jgi:hypothetical protein
MIASTRLGREKLLLDICRLYFVWKEFSTVGTGASWEEFFSTVGAGKEVVISAGYWRAFSESSTGTVVAIIDTVVLIRFLFTG